VARCLVNLLTALSLLLCVAATTLWVDGLVSGPRRFVRGSVSGGWGVAYDGVQTLVFAGDLTGDKSLKNEGKVDRASGEVKDKVGDAADKVKKAVN